MGSLSQKLRIWVLASVWITAGACAADIAKAQNGPANQNMVAAPSVEQVVVTGTSIHGQAPVGSNLISVTDVDMQNLAAVDVMDVFRDMPAISNFGAPPQGNLSNTYFMPNIHQLGASASNTTLVLIDGARVPLGGTLHALSDPGMVPEIAIRRIDVLATGASATYGSDAVAGVVNFITRSSYDGLLIQGQAGTATAGGYMKNDLGVLWGTHWGDGNVYVALQYSYGSSLRASARPFLFNADQTALATANGLPVGTPGAGATNFNNFLCNNVSIQPAGSSSIYVVQNGTTVPLANTAANSPCNMQAYNDELPSELRESARFQVTQEFGPLEVKLALNYSYRADHAIQAVGGLTGTTVFATGPQANPFFQLPAGYTGTATSEVVRWDADALLGCCATNDNGQGGGVTSDFYLHSTSTFHMDHLGSFWKGFNLTWDNVLGQDRTYSNVIGALCGSCANLALNGTTNVSGNLTQISVPGTPQIVTQLPLTPANALDVWNPPGATNRTSSNVRASLGNSTTLSAGSVSTLQQRLVLDGPLFEFWGGPLRVALGGEFMRWTDLQDFSQPNNTGPAAFGGSVRLYESNRTQAAYFGEVNIPVVGPQNAMPFLQKLDVDISGRYDTLSDVGHTANPKYAIDWTVADGLTLKATYSTAFVPPSLISVGSKSQNYLWTYASLSPSTGNINVPVALFPQIAGVLPGCPAGATSCQLTAATPGININAGGGTNIRPATGDDWAIGADLSPSFLPGFSLNVTLWNNHVKGLITSPSQSLLFQSSQLSSRDTTVCPTGCTPAQVAAFENLYQGIPVSGTLPSTIYYMTYAVQQNIIFLRAEGIDASATYSFDTDLGQFTLANNFTQFLQFDYANGPGAPYFPIIGTAGFSNTFPALAFFDTGRIQWLDPSDMFEVAVFVDFEAGYRNWSANSVTPVQHDASGNPSGGGDPVKSSTLFDVHLAYNFPNGLLEGDQLYFDGKNIFNWNPPYYNSATGYNGVVSNPIGRLLSVGFRAKL